MVKKLWLKELTLISLLLCFLLFEKSIEEKLYSLFGQKNLVIEWTSILNLFISHIKLVIYSMSMALAMALFFSLIIHLLKMERIERLFLRGASFGTAFPSIAIIALLVPTIGYGEKPVFIALVLYSLLPIFLSTTEGLKSVDKSVLVAAKGCGLNDFQILFMVELPLIKNYILSGIKTSLILNISTAAIGSVVGVNSLGLPIILGIRTNNLILIFKGAFPIAIMALLIESIFSHLEGKQKWQIF